MNYTRYWAWRCTEEGLIASRFDILEQRNSLCERSVTSHVTFSHDLASS